MVVNVMNGGVKCNRNYLSGWPKQDTTPTSLAASPASVPSFAVAQILPGDVVCLPFAFYFFERAINQDSITVKARIRVVASERTDTGHMHK